jgi:hypothetical protein
VHADKRRGRARSRILYWFRTPPGVKVGRAALDEEAIRMIEAHNPDIDFDWTRILKGGSEPAPERRHEHKPQKAMEPFPVASLPAEEEVEEDLPEKVPAELDIQLEAPATAAGARLGAEGLARLRGRYAEVLARISERVPDPERQAELKAIAERLNPDAWVTEEDVAAGLEAYEATFESLRGVVGQRRRRRRRKPRAE